VSLIEYKRQGHVTHLVLNRPSVLNAVSDDLIRELKDALFEFDADEEAFIAILSGNGRAFCSGGDVRQRQLRPIEEIRPGDVVWFSPGEKHWHGATPTTALSHIAIQERLDGKTVDWMEHVSDDQYHL